MKSFEVLAAEGNMEFIRWVVAFPWPFHAREYILRRWKGYNKNADGSFSDAPLFMHQRLEPQLSPVEI